MLYATPDAVFIEHGITSMPLVRNEPLEIAAAMFASSCT